MTKVNFGLRLRFNSASCPQNGICCCWHRTVKSSCGGWHCFVNIAFQNVPKMHHFKSKSPKIFWGHRPLPRSQSDGKGTTPPQPHPMWPAAGHSPWTSSSKNLAPPQRRGVRKCSAPSISAESKKMQRPWSTCQVADVDYTTTAQT